MLQTGGTHLRMDARREPRMRLAGVLAIAVHAIALVALTWGFHIQREQKAPVMAELWSALPPTVADPEKAAAPRPVPVVPPPEPAPRPVPRPAPVEPKETPAKTQMKSDIEHRRSDAVEHCRSDALGDGRGYIVALICVDRHFLHHCI
jgi:type IV secretory pathway VirB10-like protein